jgi:hypothetical protein
MFPWMTLSWEDDSDERETNEYECLQRRYAGKLGTRELTDPLNVSLLLQSQRKIMIKIKFSKQKGMESSMYFHIGKANRSLLFLGKRNHQNKIGI